MGSIALKTKTVVFLLVAMMFLGGIFRLSNITKNPPSLSVDEVAFGYNAYSILKTGKDQWGYFLPISFKSVGDYKNAVPTYILVPFIAAFGLNEFSVRFPTALFATLSIPLFYLFFHELLDSKKKALIGAFFLTISPWHIYFSRYLSDQSLGVSLLVLGGYLFLKGIHNSKDLWLGLSGFAFALATYTYYSERLFVPLLVIFLIFAYFKKLKAFKKGSITFLLVLISLCFPIFLSTVFGPDKNRALMTCICNDPNFLLKVITTPKELFNIHTPFLSGLHIVSSENILLFFYGIKKYLSYFQPSFLFYHSLNMTADKDFGLGVMYFFEIPFFILGLIELFKINTEKRNFIIVWILLGLIPASLTINDQHPGRTIMILPMIVLILSFGALKLFNTFKTIPGKNLRVSLSVLFIIIIFWSLAQAFLIFAVHFPKEKSEDFMQGTKETVKYAIANQNKYKEIVFDPIRGVAAPDITNIPDIYTLFYSAYDPATYQAEDKIKEGGEYGFGKFRFRQINWRVDRFKKGTLFIGSPWHLPPQDLKNALVLQKVYLESGQLVLLTVTPK